MRPVTMRWVQEHDCDSKRVMRNKNEKSIVSAESIALAVHITVPDQMLGKVDELAERVRTVLADKFKIDHPTLQFESNTCNNGQLLCCIADNGHGKHGHD